MDLLLYQEHVFTQCTFKALGYSYTVGEMASGANAGDEAETFPVDVVKLEHVYFKRLNHTLTIRINVAKDYIKIVALSEFLKTASIVGSVNDVCELLEGHMKVRKRRGFVEDDNKYNDTLAPKYEWMRHLHIILDYDRSETDRRRKVLKFAPPPPKPRVEMVREVMEDDEEGGNSGRGRVMSRVVVAAPTEEAERVPQYVPDDNHIGEFDVIFPRLPLGLRLRNRRYGRPGAMIGSFVNANDESTGQAEMCGRLNPFMRLIRVNATDVSEMDFGHVIHTVVESELPVTIRFSPPVESDLPTSSGDVDLLQLARDATSRAELEEEFSRNNSDMKVGRSLGYALYADGLYERAAAILRNIRNGEDETLKDARFWCMLGRALVRLWQGDRYHSQDIMGEAKDAYEKALEFQINAQSPNIWHEMGKVYEKYGALAGASKLYAKIIDEFPNYFRLNEVVWSAGSVLRYLDMHQDATAYIMVALDSPPPGVSKEDIALELGKCFSRQGLRTSARSAYEKAFTWSNFMNDRNDTFTALGDEDLNADSNELGEDQMGATDDEPAENTSEDAGGTVAADEEEPKKQFADWVRSVDTWTNAGKRHEANGNPLLAIDCYRQALAFSGEVDESVWWLLALAFYEIRALDDAINCCTNILALNPYNKPALDGLHRWQVELELLSEARRMEEDGEVDEAAASIQAVFRAKKDRKRVKQLREEKKAATSMQCMYRRRQAQKKVQRKREENKNHAKAEKKRTEKRRARERVMKRKQSILRLNILKKKQEEMLSNSLQRKSSWGSVLSSVPDTNPSQGGAQKLADVHDMELQEWHLKLKAYGDHFNTVLDMQRGVQSILGRTPVHPDEAFCALIDAKGDVSTALKSLADAGYFHKIRCVCNLYDIQKYAKKAEGMHKKQSFDIKKQLLATPLPDISLPQWTPDRRVLEQVELESLSPFEKRVLDQDFSNRRLMQGASTNGLPKHDSSSTDKRVEYYMLNYESQHFREWSRAKQNTYMGALLKRKSPLKRMNHLRTSPERSPSKRHNLLSPLGHDGAIPVVKMPIWRPTMSLARKGQSPGGSFDNTSTTFKNGRGVMGSTCRRSIAL